MIFGKAQRGTRRRVRLLSSRWRSRRLLQGRPQSLHRCWFSKMARLVEMLEIILLRYYLFVSIYAFFCLAQTVCPVLGAHDHPTPAHMQRFSLVLCSIFLAHNLCSMFLTRRSSSVRRSLRSGPLHCRDLYYSTSS